MKIVHMCVHVIVSQFTFRLPAAEIECIKIVIYLVLSIALQARFIIPFFSTIVHYREGGIYMSGHLHSLFEVAARMYARMQQNYLELEVGDWKDYRK